MNNGRSAEIAGQGDVSEMREVVINGVRQYIVVETQDISNPVVLFLHGGPGMAAPFGASSRGVYPEFSKNITAVYWDQRGAAKSYPGTDPSVLNVRQFTDDTVVLSEMLAEEFGQEKIFLMAFSWGTIPGLKAVYERPDLYHAYLSYAQMNNMTEAEVITYQWLLENAPEKDIAALKQIGPPRYFSESDDNVFSSISNKVSGQGEVKPNMLGILSSVLFSPDYSIKDIYNTVFRSTALNFGKSGLAEEIYALNFQKEITEVEVPIYLFNSRHDKVVPLAQTQVYFDLINAPSKELIVVEKSGHIPCPEDFLKLQTEIINIINNSKRSS